MDNFRLQLLTKWRSLFLLYIVLPFFVQLLCLPHLAHAATTSPIVVDQTQNIKAMGYTDSRKVVRDSVGNLYVAYRKKYKLSYTTAYHIFVAKSTDNGMNWRVLNDAQPIEAVGDFNQRVPAIAIDHADVLHVVWYGPDEATANDDENQIKYVRSTDGGQSWSAWRNIAPVSGYRGQALWQEHPTIYVDPDNLVYVVWEGRDEWANESAQIKVIRSDDYGLSWTSWVNIAPSTNSRSRPSLVVSGNQLHVFAYGKRGGMQQILYASSTNRGETWSGWQPVAPATQDQRHVAAAVDQAGIVHIVWRQPPFAAGAGQRANTKIYYTSFDGRRWLAPVQVGSLAGGAQTYPSIAVDAQQMVWITWTETSDSFDFPNDAPTSGAVYYAVKSAHGWSEPILYGSGGNNLYPSLRRNVTADTASMDTASMDVVWLETRPTDYAIHFAQLARPTTFRATEKQAEALHPITAAFTRIAWALEFDTASLHTIQTAAFPPPAPWLRDLRAIFMLIVVVSLYVTTKFLMQRWFQVLLR